MPVEQNKDEELELVDRIDDTNFIDGPGNNYLPSTNSQKNQKKKSGLISFGKNIGSKIGKKFVKQSTKDNQNLKSV